MYVHIPPEFITGIEELRQQIRDLPQSHTLTPSFYHHQVLDETISVYKRGYRFMPVIGASAVVKSCLMADRRRKTKHDTMKDYFKDFQTLYTLIKDADPTKIPINELLDEDETVESIKFNPPRFTKLRNKFAHGDIMEIMFSPPGFYSYLPPKDELIMKYGVELDYQEDTTRMGLPGYVQLTKCLKFLLKWRENLIAGNR